MSNKIIHPLEIEAGKSGGNKTSYPSNRFGKLCDLDINRISFQFPLQRILDNLLILFHARNCFVISVDQQSKFYYLETRSAEGKNVENPDDHVCQEIITLALNQKCTILRNSHRCNHQKKKSESDSNHRLNPILCTPIKYNNHAQHILYINKKKDDGDFQVCDIQTINFAAKLIAPLVYELSKEQKSTTEIIQREERLRRDNDFDIIIGRDPNMINLLDLIVKIKDVDAPVLIEGESGVGKELIARSIHFNSKRKDSPFFCINCGAIPETLLESEFFGYEKGAFTGAINKKIGQLTAAGEGTIFLDEVDEMSLNLQVKLLRVLQWGEFTPIGSTIPQKTNARFIATTKQNLKTLVDKGKFRDDLFYRLNVLHLYVPPLRERKADIPDFCNYFLAKYCKEMGKKLISITPRALSALMNYDYPGNVRELENILQRTVILNEGDFIDIEHLPFEIQKNIEFYTGSQSHSDYTFQRAKQKVVEMFEKKFIKDKLKASDGIVLTAAKMAGMYETNFRRKMKKYGITAKGIQ